MTYRGSFGIHFPIHQPGWLERTAPAYLDLAGRAAAGFETVWVNDNFRLNGEHLATAVYQPDRTEWRLS